MLSVRRSTLSILSLVSLAAAILPTPLARVANAAVSSASINSVSFKAAEQDTYDHEIGGGRWMDGSTTYVKGELQAADYQCGDITSYFLELNTPASPAAGSDFTAKIVLDFTRDTTGQTGVALEPLTTAAHLLVQNGTDTGDTAPNPQVPTAAIAASPAPAVTYDGGMFVSGKTAFLTFYVEHIKPNQTVIVRSDAQIMCKMGSDPTGNLQAALTSIDITSSTPNEAISAGAQTVNFKTFANLSMAVVNKTVTTGTDCATAVKLTSAVVGNAVKYCYTITNYRSDPSLDLVLVDDNATPLDTSDDDTLPIVGLTTIGGAGTLNDLIATGTATAVFSATYNSAGTYTNNVVLSYLVGSSAFTSSSRARVTVGPAAPNFTIDKTSTSSTFEQVGDVITYTITLTNTGNVLLEHANITDPTATFTTCTNSGGGGAVSQSGHASTFTDLDPSATWTCTATYTVIAGDVTAKKVDNTATGHVAELSDKTASKTVNLAVFTISKTSTSYFSKVDDVLTYTITMTNTGNVALTSVAITDPTASFTTCTNSGGGGAVGQTGHTTTSTTLAVAATWTCTATYTIVAGDVTAGKVDNTATGDTDQTGTKDASKTVNISSFTISKTSSSYFSKAGETLTYTITMTNTGTPTLTGVYITDTIATFTTCTNSGGGGAVGQSGSTSTTTTLASGKTWTCTATYTTVAGDVTAEKVDNTATGYTTEAGSKTDSKTINISKFTITKSTSSTFSKVGDVLTYTIVLTNTGTPTLTGVTIADPKATFTTCTNSGGGGAVGQSGHTSTSTTLTSGKTWTCTATYTIVAGDVTADKVDNTATGDSDQTDSKTDSKTVNASSFTITKSSSSTFSKAGETLTYTITMTNTGTPTLTGVYITDTIATFTTCTNSGGGGAVGQSGSTSTTTTLAAGKTWTCTATYTTLAGDVTAGKVDNTATGYTTEAGSKTDSKTIDISKFTISKSTSSTFSKAGETLTYTIVLTNTGTPTLTGVTIADPKAVLTTCTNSKTGTPESQSPGAHTSSSTTLESGKTWTCTATYTTVAGDVTAGKVDNTATGDSNETDSKTDSKTVNISKFTILKSTSSTPTNAGDVITYSIVLTNTGTPTLTGVTIADPKASFTTCTNSGGGGAVGQTGHTTTSTTLTSGETWTCTATYTVTQTDVDAGNVDNTATGDSNETDSKTSDKSVTITPAPAFTIVKTNTTVTAPKKAGDTVTYSIVVTNTGNVTLLAVTITDANAVIGTCNVANGSNLAPAAALTCAASHVVTQTEVDAGKTENEAIASATGQTPKTSNKVTIPIPSTQALGVTLQQLVDKKLIAGDKVKYKVVVTNTGNITLNNVTPVVTNFIITTCTPTIPTTLAPGETITCDGYHVVTEKDALAGIIRAKAVATGISSIDPAVTVPAKAPDVEVPLELPRTGTNGQSAATWAMFMILLGSGLLLVRRRRIS